MTILLVVFFTELLLYLIYKKSNLILSEKDRFPIISNELIEKFNSFYFDLGWVNKKNTIKKELSQGKEITYTYNNIGARSMGNIDLKEAMISTYGDSYCLSREVMDNKTWQYFLSGQLDTNVINFGVGNYGLDQSLLRLKKEYLTNPTKIVIMAITPYTITRVTSVWKHFSEFENLLAVKPRYIVQDNKLKFIPNILKNKEDLKDIKQHQDFFNKYDEHISYFNEHVYTFPFIFSFIKSPYPLLKSINAKFMMLFKKLKFPKIALWFSNKYFLPEINYREKLFIKNKKLLKLLIEEYITFAKENDFMPVLLMLPTIEDVRYYKRTDTIYYDAFLKSISDNLLTLDFMDFLAKEESSIGSYYIDDYWGGHYSPLGNLELANFVKEKLNEAS